MQICIEVHFKKCRLKSRDTFFIDHRGLIVVFQHKQKFREFKLEDKSRMLCECLKIRQRMKIKNHLCVESDGFLCCRNDILCECLKIQSFSRVTYFTSLFLKGKGTFGF